MSDTKIYFGQGKEFKFEDGGTTLNISFSNKDLDEMKGYLNEKGYINLRCTKRKEPSQFGQTHSIVLDTWKPKDATKGTKVTTVSNEPDLGEDCPF